MKKTEIAPKESKIHTIFLTQAYDSGALLKAKVSKPRAMTIT